MVRYLESPHLCLFAPKLLELSCLGGVCQGANVHSSESTFQAQLHGIHLPSSLMTDTKLELDTVGDLHDFAELLHEETES